MGLPMWSLRLTEVQRVALVEMLGAQPELSHALAAALEELEFARWDPLPDAQLPWKRVEELAAAQGIGEADVVWDFCGGLRGTTRSSARVSQRARPQSRAA